MKLKALFILLLCAGLTACDILSPTPQPLPTVVLGGGAAATPVAPAFNGGGVKASAVVVPFQKAQLGFTILGKVETLSVAIGDQVKPGQVLARLEGSAQLQAQQRAATSAAELALLSAQQDLDKLQKGAGLEIALAQQAVADAQKALQDAKNNRYAKNLARVSQATIDSAEAALIIAQDELKKAQENYEKFANKPEDDVMRAQAFSRLAAAQQKVDQARFNLEWLTGLPDPVEVAQADAAVALAQARLDNAQARLDKVKAGGGADPDQVALLKARIKTAEDQLEVARAESAKLELTAPFAATVSAVRTSAGSIVSPGQVLIILTDVSRLRVETTDLSELDVPNLKVGQKVAAYVKALKQTINGKVSLISPLASSLGGDVVYKATIDLDSQPTGLRAGMSVEVQFQ